jgi:hypothetical protein
MPDVRKDGDGASRGDLSDTTPMGASTAARGSQKGTRTGPVREALIILFSAQWGVIRPHQLLTPWNSAAINCPLLGTMSPSEDVR